MGDVCTCFAACCVPMPQATVLAPRRQSSDRGNNAAPAECAPEQHAAASQPPFRGRITGGGLRQQLLALLLLCALAWAALRATSSPQGDSCAPSADDAGSCAASESLALRAARLLSLLGGGWEGTRRNASLVSPLCAAAGQLEEQGWPPLLTDAARRVCATLRRGQEQARAVTAALPAHSRLSCRNRCTSPSSRCCACGARRRWPPSCRRAWWWLSPSSPSRDTSWTWASRRASASAQLSNTLLSYSVLLTHAPAAGPGGAPCRGRRLL
jgi:hypothetical protein